MATNTLGGALLAYANEKCHGTNIQLFVERDNARMTYHLILYCEFQGKTYRTAYYLSDISMRYSQSDVIRHATERMINEMNTMIAREFRSGK